MGTRGSEDESCREKGLRDQDLRPRDGKAEEKSPDSL